MLRMFGRGLLALVVLISALQPASAVIKKLTPLKELIGDADTILIAKVEKVDADKPSANLKFQVNLKGTSDFDSFAVNLKGDAFAKKDGHTKALLDRLSPGRKLVLFITKVEETRIAFGYLEGTWFQMRGTSADGGKTVTWAFLHCEPFFRRTFKGTTDELKGVVEKAVAGKEKPPEPNEKEEPGFGPLPEKKGGLVRSPMLYGVIPTTVLIAPLAVVAALFPGVFARLALTMKSWRAFLAVSSVNTTLATVYYFLRGYLPDVWLASPQAFLILMALIALVGIVWAGQRNRRLAFTAGTTDIPTKAHLYGLLGAIGGFVVLLVLPVWIIYGKATLVEVPMREFLAMLAGLVLALGYGLYRVGTRSVDPPTAMPRLGFSPEAVALAGTLLFSTMSLALALRTGPNQSGGELGDAANAEDSIGPKLADIRTFTFPGANEVMSGIAIGPEGRVYFGAESRGGTGSVWCVDPTSGELVWKFTNGGDLQRVYCIPSIADGKVFVGEGLHEDLERRMFCLDAATGKALWNVPTMSHTEGRAAYTGNKLIFSAGDDGLICIDPATRAKIWHVPGTDKKLHIDTPPAVRGRRVFFGSGYHTLALLCVDINTGDELWRTPVDLRSFGAPLARGSHVYFGLGTGNLLEDLSKESEESVPREAAAKGAIVCVAAETGKEVWRYDLPKSVHTELAADRRTVYACCKDGTAYAIDRESGRLRWKRTLGPAFASGPALATHANGLATVAVYAVTIDGRVACLNPANGEPYWQRDLAEHSQKLINVLSTPAVVSNEKTGTRTVFVGAKAENRNNGERVATVFRIEDVIED